MYDHVGIGNSTEGKRGKIKLILMSVNFETLLRYYYNKLFMTKVSYNPI